MSAPDLEAEFAKARKALSPELQEKLVNARVPVGFHSLVGAARVYVDESGFAQPHPDGDLRWAIASRAPEHALGDLEDEDPAASVLLGEITDIIYVNGSGDYAVRTGARSFVGIVKPQHHGLEVPEVPIHRTVFGWLKNGCTGIVPLTRDRARLRWLLSSIQRPVAEDEEHARELRSLRWQPEVRIGIRAPFDGVAA